MYRHLDAALIRAAAYPDGWQPPPPPIPSSDTTTATRRWRQWITEAAHPYLCEAVELASPSLAQAVRAVCAERLTEPKRVRRAGLALLRYARRIQHRATPFGLFAGIAPIRIREKTRVSWGADHELALRVDAAWLSAVVDELEACPELLRRLTVVADETAAIRGDRLVLPCRSARSTSGTPGELSVRRTAAVRTIVAHAVAPIPALELVERVGNDLTSASLGRLAELVAKLVSHGILLTELRPPMTVPDTLGHVIDTLDATGGREIPAVAPVLRGLHEVHTSLRPSPTSPRLPAAHRTVTDSMTKFAAISGPPFAGDLRLDCAVSLPTEIGREAAAAVNTLTRLTPRPSGSRSWRDFHARFLDRYGTDVQVPVPQLVDPELGLGYPAGYRSSPHPRPEPGFTDRDEQLLALAQQAAYARAQEVVLDDSLIGELAVSEPVAELPHTELCFRLEARSPQALDHGEFTLVVSGLSPAAGAFAGRFLPLLGAEDRDRMVAAYAGLPTLSAGARRAQLSSPPLHIRTDNVARVPAIFPDVVSVSEHHPDGLALNSLVVAADAERMYLISRDTGEPIEPIIPTAVDLPSFSHPLARFLCELPRAHTAAVSPFHWGAATNLPFLPRVRYGRAVLAPATWRLRAAELPGSGTSAAEWTEELHSWCRRLSVPRAVDVGDDDRRLRLSLRNGADLSQLRNELARSGRVTLREAPEERTAYGWFGGRPHEITLALVSGQPPRPGPNLRNARVIDCRDRDPLVGVSRLTQARLASHHVPELLRRLRTLSDQWPRWWFVRGHDHLQLTFRLTHPDEYGRLAATVGTWAEDLRRSGLLHGLSWESPNPNAVWHGEGGTTAALEEVFAADTDAVLAQLVLAGDGAPHPLAIAAAGLVDLVTSFLGDSTAGMRWLIDNPAPRPAGPLDHAITTDVIRLWRISRHHEDPFPGERLTTAWEARRAALSTFRSRLVSEGRPPRAALPTLIGQHLLRALGPENSGEHACRCLARAAALSWQATEERAEA